MSDLILLNKHVCFSLPFFFSISNYNALDHKHLPVVKVEDWRTEGKNRFLLFLLLIPGGSNTSCLHAVSLSWLAVETSITTQRESVQLRGFLCEAPLCTVPSTVIWCRPQACCLFFLYLMLQWELHITVGGIIEHVWHLFKTLWIHSIKLSEFLHRLAVSCRLSE